MTRAIRHRYEDPFDTLWLETARRIGLRVRRSADVFAATDGDGTLTVGAPATLDADDSLAQMIFHELCHSLVEGAESFEVEDWGLDNIDDRHRDNEYACLRTQAVLSRRYGLEVFFAPTTEHRVFYDGLGADPLAGDDASVSMARRALSRAARDPWGPHLEEALSATRRVLETLAPFARAPSLASTLSPLPPRHPAGLGLHPNSGRTCGDCAWRGASCLQVEGPVEPTWPACARFEAAIACEDCGACCRQAYGRLELDAADPFVKTHADLVTREDGRLALVRIDGRCPPLVGDGSPTAPYRCRLHDTRPQTCREFERGGAHCLEARRRVGRSL
ncbi:MAG: YkgJ family cysteine cluster protein [Sandaracinaceae bacterium]